MRGLMIRDAEVRGQRVDVLIRDGVIAAIGERLNGGWSGGGLPGDAERPAGRGWLLTGGGAYSGNMAVIDARGGALIPGLADHHCHLLATAARRSSVSLAGATTLDEVGRRIRAAAGHERDPLAMDRRTGSRAAMSYTPAVSVVAGQAAPGGTATGSPATHGRGINAPVAGGAATGGATVNFAPGGSANGVVPGAIPTQPVAMIGRTATGSPAPNGRALTMAGDAGTGLADVLSGSDTLAAQAGAALGTGSGWLRATDLDETLIGLPDADVLEAMCPGRPLRVQDRTGALWLFNRTALAMLGDTAASPLERDGQGRATGRLWRGDGWLRQGLGGEAPDLAPIGRALSAMGVTHVTDASATNDAASGAIFSAARNGGALPQHLMLMSGGALQAPADGGWRVGPVKLVLDERDLPPLDDLVARIAGARAQGRAVAAHCATDGELALMVAALGESGAGPGDRIEHGSMIDAAMIPMLAALGVTVVTQPAFVHDRGDRYRATIPADQHDDLYRIASLDGAGVPMAASSDAPYATLDPWAGMRAAVDRTTARGAPLGQGERVTAARALSLYLGHPDDPGRRMRRVAVGEPADLCLLHTPMEDALRVLDASLVATTIIGGTISDGSARLD